MFVYNPKNRISAKEALKHQYLQIGEVPVTPKTDSTNRLHFVTPESASSGSSSSSCQLSASEEKSAKDPEIFEPNTKRRRTVNSSKAKK